MTKFNRKSKNILPSVQDDNLANDLARVREAIKSCWNVPQKTKNYAVQSVLEIMEDKDKEISTKDRLAAIRLLGELAKLNLDTYKAMREDVKPDDDDGDNEIIIKIT